MEKSTEASKKQQVATGDNAAKTSKPAEKTPKPPAKPGKEGKLKETVYKCCGQKAFFDESNLEHCFGNFKDCPLYRVGDQSFTMEKCANGVERKDYDNKRDDKRAVDRCVSYAPKVEQKVETEKSMSIPCGFSHHSCCPMPPVDEIFKPTNFNADRTDVQKTQTTPTQCAQSMCNSSYDQTTPNQCAQSMCSPSYGQTNIDRLIVAANVEKDCSRNKCTNSQPQNSCACCSTCPPPDNRKKDCSNCKCCDCPKRVACDKGDTCKSGIMKVTHCGESPNCVNELETRQDMSKCESNNGTKCQEAKCVPHIHVMSNHNATCKPPCETQHCCKPQCEAQQCCKPQCEVQQCCKPQCESQHCCKPQCETKHCCKPHKETKFLLPADSKCVSQSCAKCTPQSGPKCMSQSSPKCVPQSSPKRVSQSSPKCVPQSSPKRVSQSSPKCVPQSVPKCISQSGPKCVPQNKSNCMSNNGANCIINNKSSCIRQNICENHSNEAFVVNNEFIIGKENVPMNMPFDYAPIIKNKCAKTKTRKNSQCFNGNMELQKFMSSSYPHKNICNDKTSFRVGDVQRSLLNSNRYFKVVKSNPYVQSRKYHNYKQPYYIGPKTMKYSNLRSKSRYSSPVTIKTEAVDPIRCPHGAGQCCEHKTQKPNPTQCAAGITNQSNSLQGHGSTDGNSDSTEMSQESSNQSTSVQVQFHYLPVESESNMQRTNNCDIQKIQCCAQECSEPREQCCENETTSCCENEATPCCECQCEPMHCNESEIHHCDSLCESRAKIYVKHDKIDCPKSKNKDCKIIHYYIPVQYCEDEIKESKECCKTMKYAGPEMTECGQKKSCEPNLKVCKPDCKQHSELRVKNFKQPCEGDLKDHNARHNHQEHCGVKDDPCICDFKDECVDYDSKCEPEKSNVAPVKKRHSEIMSRCLCQDDTKHCPKSAFLPHTYCHLSKDKNEKPSDRSCKGFWRQKPRNSHSPFCPNFEELCKVPQFVCYHKPKMEKDDYSWRFTGSPCTYPTASRHTSLPGREEKKVTTAEEVQQKGEDGKEIKVAVKDPMEKDKEIDDKKTGEADKKPGVADKEKGMGEKQKVVSEKGKAESGKKATGQTKGSHGKQQNSNTKTAASKKAQQKGVKSKSTESVSGKSAKSKASGKHAKQAPPKKKK